MELDTMTARALAVRAQLEQYECERYGRAWSLEELVLGLVGDVGDLAKLIQAREGVRAIESSEARLEHELADVLWSVIVIAARCEVDLAEAFQRTMDEIELSLAR